MGNLNISAGSGGFGGFSRLSLNPGVYTKLQKNITNTSIQLVLNTDALDHGDAVCGTECMVQLFQNWRNVAKAGDTFRNFSCGALTRALINQKNSIIQTDIDSARSVKLDEETKTKVDAWVAGFNSNDPTIINKLKSFQNLTDEQWANLSDEQYKDFAALTALFIYSGNMLEQSGTDKKTYDKYANINEQITSNLYKVDPAGDNKLYANASLDYALVSNMKASMESLGASDSLAYNVLSKLENDGNTYRVNNPDSHNRNVDVSYYRDESGFTVVNVKDSYFLGTDYAEHSKQFFASGKENAASYLRDKRAGAANYDNHGLTDDELIGMFQTVENPNDLKIMTNIALSDSDFNIKGKDNAFDIDYFEDYSDPSDFARGISDNFSVSLAQMGATLLNNPDTTDYKKYLKATLESSINGNAHNILLDIASGAGVYADTCSLAVMNDQKGGDNDEALRHALNAANSNYGVFSGLYTNYGNDASYHNIEIGQLSYDPNTGDINLNTIRDKEERAFLSVKTTEKEQVEIRSSIKDGHDATGEKAKAMEKKLQEELDRKKKNIAVDCLIDLTGLVNPLLKDGIYMARELSDADKALKNSTNLVKDALKERYGKSHKYVCTGASIGATAVGGLVKYQEALDKFEKDKNEWIDVEKLQSFYSYNTGSGAVGIYNYDAIRLLQEWDKNGISEIIKDSGMTNDQVFNSIHTGNDYSNAVVKKIGEDLCPTENFGYLGPGANSSNGQNVDSAYQTIAEKTGYTDKDIDCALKLLIYGSSESGSYSEIRDIPFDLMNSCLDAISEKDGANVDVYNYWANRLHEGQ